MDKYLYSNSGEKMMHVYYSAYTVDRILSFRSRTNYLKDSLGNRFTEHIEARDKTYTYYDKNIVKVIVYGCLNKIDELTLYSYDEAQNKITYSYEVRKEKDAQSRLKLCNNTSKTQYIKEDKKTRKIEYY